MHHHTQKQKKKQKLPITCDTKLTTAYTPNVECGMRKEYESILAILAWNPW